MGCSMAGKGGGAWKVAYADFVTAMMAFFLVMWLTSQDKKVRESVATYFMDPLGHTRKPGREGSLFRGNASGSVPEADAVSLGKGRAPYSPGHDASQSTKQVSDYLIDGSRHQYWAKQAREHLERASTLQDVRSRSQTPEGVAVEGLSKQMREEFHKGIPPQVKGIYRDLLNAAVSEVNWKEIAQDVLRNTNDR